MLSLTTESIRWLLSGILSGILFEILLLSPVMVFQSTASIWSIGKSLTFSGILLFGMSEAFSYGICAVSSKFETITFLDGVFSIATI